MKKNLLMLLSLLMLPFASTFAQRDKYKDYPVIYTDTVDYTAPTKVAMVTDTIYDPMRVVTNRFSKNWFVFGTIGAHSFRGDYSSTGSFGGTISPDWSIGIGKWFTPGIALKLEFIKSNSRGWTEYLTGHYGYGDVRLTDDNTPYRKMKTGWWDISGNVVLNLTRLFFGYEGAYSKRHMNQFMFAGGIGGVHHTGFGHSGGSDNEWSGHLELQYSRFFTPRKNFSVDLKARGLFYQTNFDLEYGQADHYAQKWDCNLGIDLGFTWYLGTKKSSGWKRSATAMYRRDYRERDILTVKAKDNSVTYRTMTFYVFYPNNYSGRSDAPSIANSKVNAIDYLAGGLFTQKRYVDNGQVASRLADGKSPIGLATEDIATETADRTFDTGSLPRGYEMSKEPLSLSLKDTDMANFRKQHGYYYAPIYDGQHTWQYRIDKETEGQKLLSDNNYMETTSFGLNQHEGLATVRKNMDVEKGEELVSFADVYAAMNSNEGYIAQYTDTATVSHIKDILKNGTIAMIQCEGLATSQDNYTGDNASQVGRDRNSALSQNRAATVISWLKQKPCMKNAASQIYMVGDMSGNIRTVTDKSTRGLNAKLNRCVKVRIHYLLK